MAKQFLRRADVARRYGVTIRTLERMVIDERLPKPHYRGRIPLFDEDELDKSDRAFALAARPPKARPKARTAELPKPARPKSDDGGDGGAVAA